MRRGREIFKNRPIAKKRQNALITQFSIIKREFYEPPSSLCPPLSTFRNNKHAYSSSFDLIKSELKRRRKLFLSKYCGIHSSTTVYD